MADMDMEIEIPGIYYELKILRKGTHQRETFLRYAPSDVSPNLGDSPWFGCQQQNSSIYRNGWRPIMLYIQIFVRGEEKNMKK